MASAALLRQKVLTYWFKGITREAPVDKSLFGVWFGGGPQVDQFIKTEFEESIHRIHNDLAFQTEMTSEPEGAMAAIILLDQFTRNAFRKTPEMFAYDPLARSIANAVIEKSWDKDFHPVWRGFVYLPFEHSEDINDQNKCVELYNTLIQDVESNPTDKEHFLAFSKSFHQYGLDHQKVIQRFGRFPHRNEILGREPTQEEVDYLANGGQRF